MAKVILKNVDVEVDGTDLSERASSCTVETNADDVDLTAFKSDFKEHGTGLRDATIAVDFFQDFATGMVDDTLWPLALSGEVFRIIVTDNDGGGDPFAMDAVLQNYTPMGGNVGEASKTTVTFLNAGSAGIERVGS